MKITSIIIFEGTHYDTITFVMGCAADSLHMAVAHGVAQEFCVTNFPGINVKVAQ